jgi:hypothetical protein
VNYWVAESILTQHDAKKRCTVIRRFISVAEACAHLNNFSGVMAILAGFNMAPVFRLKRTWDVSLNLNIIIIHSNLIIVNCWQTFNDLGNFEKDYGLV